MISLRKLAFGKLQYFSITVYGKRILYCINCLRCNNKRS